jgi:hypothetical protein
MPVLWALADPKIGEREVLAAMLDVEPHLAAARPGLALITDKGFAGRETEADLAARGITLLRPSRKDETARPGEPLLKSVRQLIESVNDTLKLVLYVSPDSTCWSALDPLVFRRSRCRRVLTPPADNHTWPFLAGAESAVCRSVSRWSARRRSLWPNDLYTRRRTAIIAAPRKGPHTRSGVRSHRQTPPVDQQLDPQLIDKWRQNSPA